jgi:rhodanese-related sulfurtransferase
MSRYPQPFPLARLSSILASAASPALAAALAAAPLLSGCIGTSSAEPAKAGPAAKAGLVAHLDATRFRALAEQKGGLYLDVRTPGEVASGVLPGASTIDISDGRFQQRAALLSRSRPVFVYCASGYRSRGAAQTLHDLGFAEVYNLEGGVYSWRRSGFPLDRPSGAVASAAGLSPEAFDGLRRSEKRLLVDFQTPWCEPCKKMAPVVDALAESWKGRARVLRVDVDQSEALAGREKVEGVPLLVLYVDGKERWRHSGELPLAAVEAELAKD